ncbi:DUF6907 domain-containing protein [Streptomyces hygroscopicus]|uniref:DUF6907 domain-containing protein n=1 Tax=Streptomyces hygroscopicus TaxID=1912 RepID=UPI0033E576F2
MSDRIDVRPEGARTANINPAALSSGKIRAALAGIPQQPTREKADQPARTVTVTVRGTETIVDCPAWCVVDHSTVRLVDLSDLYHEGETIALAAPQFDGRTEVLAVAIRQDPFYMDADERLPYLSLDAAGDGSDASLPPAAALAFIDQARAHLDKMRDEIRKIASVPAQPPVIPGVAGFTLSYETSDGPESRHLHAAGVETVGKVVQSMANRGEVWNIQVHDDSGVDVTFDFGCFAEDAR